MHRCSKLKTPALFAMAWILACGAPVRGAHLSPAVARAYEDYIAKTEARMQRYYTPGGPFLWTDAHAEPDAESQLRSGRVLVACVAGCDTSGVPVPGGLIHDWVAEVFVPGASLAQALAVVQDYDHAEDRYRPNVLESRVLSHAGNHWRVFLRLKQSDLLTVVFDTEYDIQYFALGAWRVYSISHSTRIAQVENPGEPHEHELPPGKDEGFLWRLDSYWGFEQASGGVYIQCEAISLTRDIPAGLGWAVKPFIKGIPATSLRFTLDATRKALLSGSGGRSQTHSTNQPQGGAGR